MNSPRGRRQPSVHGVAASNRTAPDAGYNGTGLSVWSRQHGRGIVGTVESAREARDEGRSEAELIRDETRALGKLIIKAEQLGPGDALDKCLKNIGIKERFLITLRTQLASQSELTEVPQQKEHDHEY